MNLLLFKKNSGGEEKWMSWKGPIVQALSECSKSTTTSGTQQEIFSHVFVKLLFRFVNCFVEPVGSVGFCTKFLWASIIVIKNSYKS